MSDRNDERLHNSSSLKVAALPMLMSVPISNSWDVSQASSCPEEVRARLFGVAFMTRGGGLDRDVQADRELPDACCKPA